MNTTNRPYCTGTRLVMYQLLYLTVNAPSTLNATGTRNYGVISILGVGITSLGGTPGIDTVLDDRAKVNHGFHRSFEIKVGSASIAIERGSI